jgi:hypothetical protein
MIIVVFLFILKFEAYEVYALQCCIFAPSFGMHKKTPQPDVSAVSTGTVTHVELSNVIAALCYCHNLAEPEGGPRTRWAQKMNTVSL